MSAFYLPRSKLPEIFLSGTLPSVPKILIFISASVPAKGALEVSTTISISKKKLKCDMKACKVMAGFKPSGPSYRLAINPGPRCMGCLFIAGLSLAINSPLRNYTPVWREALLEYNVFPKNTTSNVPEGEGVWRSPAC